MTTTQNEANSVEASLTRLEVVMNHGRLNIYIEIAQSAHRLHYDRARLLLRYGLVLLEKEVEIVALAVFEHRAEAAQHTKTRTLSMRHEQTMKE